nr:signal peptidase I [Nocardioides thalensis]
MTIGAIVGSLCLLLALAGLVAGVKPLVFRSGSMGPEIPAGALGLSRPVAADDLAVGDVVSVVTSDGTRVTHRIVGIAGEGEVRVLTLQGDANAAPDVETYPVGETDRVFWSVPVAGYVVSWIGTPLGMCLMGGFVLAMLVVIFRRRPAGGKRRATGLAAAGAAAAVTVAATTGTAAAFTDTSAATGGALAAHTVASQAQPQCQNVDGVLILGNIARLTWTQVDSRYEYVWEVQTTGGAAVASGVVGNGTATGATVTLDIGTGLVGINANYTVIIRARLTATTSWVAATTTSTPIRRASILIIGAAMRCGWA